MDRLACYHRLHVDRQRGRRYCLPTTKRPMFTRPIKENFLAHTAVYDAMRPALCVGTTPFEAQKSSG